MRLYLARPFPGTLPGPRPGPLAYLGILNDLVAALGWCCLSGLDTTE